MMSAKEPFLPGPRSQPGSPRFGQKGIAPPRRMATRLGYCAAIVITFTLLMLASRKPGATSDGSITSGGGFWKGIEDPELRLAAWRKLQKAIPHRHGKDVTDCSRGSFATRNNIPCQVRLAQAKFHDMLAAQSKTPEEAKVEYRRRYQREPPAGFENWVNVAIKYGSPIIDDFDTVNEDLAAFRKFSPAALRERVHQAYVAGHRSYLEIKDGKVLGFAGEKMPSLRSMIEPIARFLPNLIIPLNDCDEPRVIAAEHPEKQDHTIQFDNLKQKPETWDMIHKPCAWRKPHELHSTLLNGWLDDSKDVCLHPELREEFGFFMSPSYFVHTETVYPVVGLSSMSNFADLRAPPGSYFEDNFRHFNKVDRTPFLQKENRLHWRGSSTGFYPRVNTWRDGHRQRLVLIANGLDDGDDMNDALAAGKATPARVEPWQVDVGFSGFSFCDADNDPVCTIQEKVMGTMPHATSDDEFKYRYVFDIDGNSMSGRFYRMLDSNSVVFKATVQREWHDQRLIPWIHFVPISMSLKELPSVLQFFTSTNEGKQIGELISTSSREWAKASLRQADLTLHWYRLLLEYAAIYNDPQEV